jgi:predicted metal-dependent peptidase
MTEPYITNFTIEDAILAARVAEPYFARAYASLFPVERVMRCPVSGIPTLAVDPAWRLYWSREALGRFDLKAASNVLMHEVRHLLRDHAGRRYERIPAAWNVAGDREINDDIPVPPDGALPKHIGMKDGLLAEEYYAQSAQQATSSHACSCGSGSGGEKLDGEEDSGSTEPGLAPVESRLTREQVAADVRKYAAENAGTVPAGDVVWANAVEEASKEFVPWDRILSTTISRAMDTAMRGREDYSRHRLSRRWRHGTPLKPCTVSPTPRIGLVFDTSGSMSNLGGRVLAVTSEIERMVGEIYHQWDCDAAAIKHSRGAKHVGGGGTILTPAIEEAARTCDVVVVITDGVYPGYPATPPEGAVVVTALLCPEYRKHIPEWANIVEVV